MKTLGGFIDFVAITYSTAYKVSDNFSRLLMQKNDKGDNTRGNDVHECLDDDHRSRTMVSNHINWRQTLVPLQWIAKWFRKEHWNQGRAATELMNRRVMIGKFASGLVVTPSEVPQRTHSNI